MWKNEIDKRIILIIFLLFSSSLYSQVDVYYTASKQKFDVYNTYYGTKFKLGDDDNDIGYPTNAIKIRYVNIKNDTISIFNSFGCTQYFLSEDNKSFNLYSWVNYQGYSSGECICVDEMEPEIVCRPDTSEALIKFYFQFNKLGLKLSVSEFKPLEYTSKETLTKIQDLVNNFNKKNIVNLKNTNDENYDYTYETMRFLISYYYSFSFYCLINNKTNILEIVDNFIINNYNVLEEKENIYFDISFIKYCQILRKTIWIFNNNIFNIPIKNTDFIFSLSIVLSTP